MLPLAKYSDIFETRLQPQIVSGERLSMLQDFQPISGFSAVPGGGNIGVVML